MNKNYRDIAVFFPRLDGSGCQGFVSALHLSLNGFSSAMP